MSKRLTIKYCHDFELKGSGHDLAATFKGSLQRRRAKALPVEVSLELGRCMVRTVLQQIGQMHERDRQRIEGELQRIRLESRQLLPPDKS
jgi:ABC-type phosphate transport system auxiliary subunit